MTVVVVTTHWMGGWAGGRVGTSALIFRMCVRLMYGLLDNPDYGETAYSAPDINNNHRY